MSGCRRARARWRTNEQREPSRERSERTSHRHRPNGPSPRKLACASSWGGSLMRAEEILQKLPAELFPGTPRQVREAFKTLAKVWHPDHNKTAEAGPVFEHIKRCRDYLLTGQGKSITLHTRESSLRYSYISEAGIKGCKVLIGATTICYLITDPDLRVRAERVVLYPWKFRDEKQKKEMTRYLPEPNKTLDAREGLLLAFRRRPGDVLLTDLVNYHKARDTRVPPAAIMWMVSGLLNLACYLEVSGVTHCAIREEFVAVNLDEHETRLEGPALFCCKFGLRPELALAETLRDYPLLRTKGTVVRDSRLDLTLIRSLVMRLLGHRTVRQVRDDPEVPAGLAKWLESPPPASAIDDYVAWEALRGKREFHIYGLSARDIYVSLL
jgi:hypothetical protein